MDRDVERVLNSTAQKKLQSVLTRAMILTDRLDASIAFYRDVLGQEIIEDRVMETDIGREFIDGGANAKYRLVVFKGEMELPGSTIAGGRVGVIAIDDPDAPKGIQDGMKNRRGRAGDTILVFQVKRIDEIATRARAAGVRILFGPQVSPHRLARHMLMVDPNGMLCELIELYQARVP
jgi:catechol 2,3-dioxygenase-like lactoylglutathione lyase family enzyme